MRRKVLRSVRVNRISRKLAARYTKHRHSRGGGKKPFARKPRRPRIRQMIAYDLETTRIKAGTPEVKYLTAYGADIQLAIEITSLEHLREVLLARFLIPEYVNARFVAWNGNNYDVFFVARALLTDADWIIRPYLTKGKNLRGLKVSRRDNPRMKWEFLDGLSMTGLGSTSVRKLADFLKVFAPDFLKLESPDWEREEFNPQNAKHREYAMRDSEGLYHGLQAVEKITTEHFGMPLQPTIGNMGIKIFQAMMPENKIVWEPSLDAVNVIRKYVMRGGYCYSVKRYSGPVWKYDINQAYAAAMRETRLPAGGIYHCRQIHPHAKTGMYKLTATAPRGNLVPFYYRDAEGISVFGIDEISETWLTITEIEQLKTEGWKINITEGYFWDDWFRMSDYVDKLEQLRMNAPGGPNGAQGLIMKCIGNNSYGKTVETLDGIELLMSLECPIGFFEYQGAEEIESEIERVLWFKFGKPMLREYHQPQIGAFITAHVRMVVRRAALLAPREWLYADTDCVMFSKPVSLPIDVSTYGLWKIEESGADYWVINKKVYARHDGLIRHAKGLNVRNLTTGDFAKWFDGAPPFQNQIQKQNFVKVITGGDMFADRGKYGAAVDENGQEKGLKTAYG